MRRVIVLSLVAACEDIPPPDFASSGSRLKLAWFEFDDGQRTWDNDLVDARWDVPCIPRRWADGVELCTPPLGSVFYEDDRCTKPVASDEDVRFASPTAKGECGISVPAKPVYVVSKRRRVVPRAYARNEQGCVPAFLGEPVPIREIDEQRDPSNAFVRLSHVLVGDGRAVVDTLQGSDGLVLPDRIHDRDLDVSCGIYGSARLAPGTLRKPCHVIESEHADFFADAQCLVPAVGSQCGHRPVLAGLSPPGAICTLYFKVANELDEVHERPTQATCRLVAPDEPVYALGKQVTPIVLTREIAPSPTRTQIMYETNGTMRFRRTDAMFDTVLDAPCDLEPLQSDPNTFECRPSGYFLYQPSDLYSDTACTQRVVDIIERLDPGPCQEATVPAFYAKAGRTYRIGSVHADPLYMRLNGACSLYPSEILDLIEIPDATRPRAVKRRDR